MSPGQLEGHPTLGAEMRAVASTRIVRGAMEALAQQGLDATVDDVAIAAGVGRRTVFRHFPTQAELFVAAIEEVNRIYDASLPPPADPDTPLDDWLVAVATAYHELNTRYVGRAFWDIHIRRPGTAPEVLAAIGDVTSRRYQYAKTVAGAAWRMAGGTGSTPEWVVDAFGLHLSAFATFALPRHTPERAGQVCARILSAVLADALADPLEQ